jgi:putative thiamine transport system permease protein
VTVAASDSVGPPPPRRRRRGGLHFVPALTLLVMLGPVAAGLVGTVLPALGILPAIGAAEPTLAPFRDLLSWPGLPAAVRLSVTSGMLATAISLGVVALIVASLHGTRSFRFVERALSPLLSVPHAAAAFGLAFLVAPSGWFVRAVSPALTGWDRPPDLLIVQDPWGLTLVAGLVAKEVPFLLLMTIAALGQVDAERRLTVARSLGYGREAGWFKAVFPQVYAQIRLAVYVVLAFSMTVVDVAMILGPNTPPTLSVQLVRWMGDPELTLRLRSSAAAVLQLALVVGALAAWRLAEMSVARVGRRAIWRGRRGRHSTLLRPLSLALAAFSVAAVGLGLAGLAVWSFAGYWAFPEALPEQLTYRNWQRFSMSLLDPAVETALIAAVAALVALLLTIGCLESEHRHGVRPSTRALWLLYAPLLVPQVAFLPGLQTAFLVAGVDGGRTAVMMAHLVFVLPYVFLSLSEPFRAWDARFGTVAASLGARPDRVLWRVRLPMLLAPVLTAFAVGFAVSVGQYLPTLLIGGGRVQTLTTEAVALASGGDRRAIGVGVLAQTAAAFVPFALALAVPRLVRPGRG